MVRIKGMALTNRTLTLLLKLNQVLTEGRTVGQFHLGDSVDMLSADDNSLIASLTWNIDTEEYEIAELVEMRTNG